MSWIKRKIDEHRCKSPVLDSDVHYGDIWECDECKQKWIVHEDQRNGKWFDIHEV